MLDRASSAKQTASTGANIATSQYAKRTRDLISLVTDIRAMGAQADFDLPRIAVIGNQSAGKSSVVEATSGITVPRASGTCTRCPMECRLTHSERPWQCQVLIRHEVDASGNKISAYEELFGDLLLDKEDLEEMIRRGQLAVLNPSLPPKFFVDFDTSSLKPGQAPNGSERQLQFSDNVVCLDISGPDVTDLSFIDLPGIISNVAAGEDRGNIDAVKNMVTKHIEGNTLILLTITMRDDIDNQGAAHLARLADEEGARTIGVLTKPDTIQHGEEDAWLRVLEGSSHPLKHGYFVTKQPSPKELEEGISFSEARWREEAFFQDTYPWATKTDLFSRMGTPNLTKALSKLLGGIINQALPSLRHDLKASLADVRNQLASLPPPPPENAATELLRLVTRFSADVNSLVQGNETFERLMQRCRPAYARFARDIRHTAPDFRPFVKGEDDADEWVVADFEPADAVGEDGEKVDDDEGDVKSKAMFLNDVRAHIQRSLTRELPHNVPFAAKVALIQTCFVSWATHSEHCFGTVHAATASELRDLVRSHFAAYRTTALCDHVEAMLEGEIERARSATLDRVKWMLELEHPPFTSNEHYFSSYRERYLARFKDARKHLGREDGGKDMSELMGMLAKFGFTGLKEEDLGKLHEVDQYEEELIVMAETAAYFHVAYKRIIDNIPRTIDHDFLRAIAGNVQGALVEGLGLGEDNAGDRARAYLSEDEGVSAHRAALEQKKTRLENVQRRLYNFGM